MIHPRRRARSRSTSSLAHRRRRRAGRRSRPTPRARVDAARAVVDRTGRRRRAGLRHQHRLRRARRNRDPARRARRAAAQPAAQPRRRRRRAAAGARGARVDGAARQRARQGLLRHPPRDARAAARAAQPRASTRVVPSRGSVGASGDLAPLAHLALVLIGEGAGDGRRRSPACAPAREALRAAGLAPVTLAPKEGLALINGTQPSTAVAALARRRRRAARARRRHRRRAVDRRAARVDASRSTPRIHDARPHAGQRASAANILRAARRTAPSTSRTSTAAGCRTPTRCAARRRCTAPRATRCASSRTTLTIEANAATDNPMVFARRRTRSSRAATSTARRSRSPPTCWRSRWRSSRRSASGARIGSSTRR